MKKLILANESNKKLIRLYFNRYLKELSKYDDTITFCDGKPVYRWFDSYFLDNQKHIFLYKENGKLLGFCFVREISPKNVEISEFYVLKKYRKCGIGSDLIYSVLDMFEGKIHISTTLNNKHAIKFWSSIYNQFLNGKESMDKKRKVWALYTNKPKTHLLNLRDVFYQKIYSKEKVYEGRLNTTKIKHFSIGDKILFVNQTTKEQMTKKVINIFNYYSFDEMLQKLDKSKLGFGDKTIQQTIDIYREIYPFEREHKFGVVAIEVADD